MVPFEGPFNFYFAQVYLEKEHGFVCIINYIIEAGQDQVHQFARYAKKVNGQLPVKKHPFAIIQGGKSEA